jgi:uncharacterized protein YdiU (UPF0061 family)
MTQWENSKLPLLQLGSDFYDTVTASQFPQKKLCYVNMGLKLDFDMDHLWSFKPLKNNLMQCLALRYHGHQFQHYNPEIGDGRGFVFAQILKNNQWYDLGTKGSGTTPHSRSGDGKLTLKGAVREALATEMLTALQVDTSQTACFFETGEKLIRGDEPSPTRSAVLTRFSRGHIRIGTFQRLAYFNQLENIKKLTSYCFNFYYQNEFKLIDPTDDNLISNNFFQLVCDKNADLVAQIMMSGFIHGVLNTDNINISGELFDYGPYRFMPQYDAEFTAAYFDQEGLYCYGRQPHSFFWNLNQLGHSLKKAYPDLEFEKILENFSLNFNNSIQKYFSRRINLKFKSTEDCSIAISEFFKLMEENKLFFEQTFFDFHSFDETSMKLKKYSKYSTENLFAALSKAEILDLSKKENTYFKNEKPETLLIDEIESIWTAINQNDDWSLFNSKIQSIRKMSL